MTEKSISIQWIQWVVGDDSHSHTIFVRSGRGAHARTRTPCTGHRPCKWTYCMQLSSHSHTVRYRHKAPHRTADCESMHLCARRRKKNNRILSWALKTSLKCFISFWYDRCAPPNNKSFFSPSILFHYFLHCLFRGLGLSEHHHEYFTVDWREKLYPQLIVTVPFTLRKYACSPTLSQWGNHT